MEIISLIIIIIIIIIICFTCYQYIYKNNNQKGGLSTNEILYDLERNNVYYNDGFTEIYTVNSNNNNNLIKSRYEIVINHGFTIYIKYNPQKIVYDDYNDDIQIFNAHIGTDFDYYCRGTVKINKHRIDIKLMKGNYLSIEEDDTISNYSHITLFINEDDVLLE